MRRAVLFVIILILLCAAASAEPWTYYDPISDEWVRVGIDPQLGISFPAPTLPISGYPAITVGVNNFTDNASSSSTTVVVDIGTPNAGSVIRCDIKYSNSATFTSVADNVNSGVYLPEISRLRRQDHSYVYGSYYKENVAASDTTITLTYSPAETNGGIYCEELRGTPSTYALDSSVMQSRTNTSTNPANGNSYTPFANNEIVISAGQIQSGTNTAGTNFTLDANTNNLYSEHWVQTTKTATTGPYTDASSVSYGIGMAAYGQNHAGTCGASAIIDWNGCGSSFTTGTVQASTYGDQAQPNADKLAHPPGIVFSGSGTGLSCNTSAYQPLATTRSCPFYSGTGAGSNTLGLDHASGTAGGLALYFDTTNGDTTASTCIQTTASPGVSSACPGGSCGLDSFVIFGGDNTGNADYVNLAWGAGAAHPWQMEPKCGGTPTYTGTNLWAANSKYFVVNKYHQAGQHEIYIYTGCGASPPLLLHITSSCTISGGGPADQIHLGNGGNDTWSTGADWYYGAVCLDYIYGTGCTQP